MITQPGIFFDVDPAEYYADLCPEPSVTQSLLKLLLDQSPAHARQAHPRLTPAPSEPEEYKKERVIGDAVHMLLLGRGKRLAIFDHDSWRGNNAKDRDAAFAEGKTPILQKHLETAQQVVRAAEQQLIQRGLFNALKGEGGHSEVVLAWREMAACRVCGGSGFSTPGTGYGDVCSECGGLRDLPDFWCRTMIDRLTDAGRHIIDIKTTGTSAAPQAIGNMVADWAIQSAMHERGLNTLDPDNAGRRRYTYICIEQYEPFALAAYDLPESVLHYGRMMLGMGLEIWGECMRTGRWPAYPVETLTPALPAWIENKMLARQMEREEHRAPQPTWDTLAEKRMDLPADGLMGG